MRSVPISWGVISSKLLTGGASGPYYFILLIIQFYLITPWLLRLINLGRRGGVVAVLINAFALGCFYFVRLVLHETVPVPLYGLPAYSWFIFYYSGLYAGQSKGIENRLAAGLTRWVALTVLFYLASCAEAVFIITKTGDASFALSSVKFFSFAFSLAVITVFFGLKSKIKTYPQMLVTFGEYSFGIYLIHMIVLSRLMGLLSKMGWFAQLPIFPVVLLAISTVGICICVAVVTRKVLGRKLSMEVFGL
jgi:membrane-bound acyltransferase YfiQ involved in biofilm formation